MELEPVDESLRPGGISPDELALRVVERALDDGGARQLVEIGGCADVVGVEVRDEHRRDAPARLAELGRPRLLRVGKTHARVDERPAVVAGQEVRVDVPGSCRQRQRDAADPVAELVHRPTLTRPVGAPCRDRTYVLLCPSASRLPDRALQVGVDRRPRDALQVVVEPVHGLRAPVHVLLRQALRAARRSPVRRSVRPVDSHQAKCRRGAPARARAPFLETRRSRARHRDRSVPTC